MTIRLHFELVAAANSRFHELGGGVLVGLVATSFR